MKHAINLTNILMSKQTKVAIHIELGLWHRLELLGVAGVCWWRRRNAPRRMGSRSPGACEDEEARERRGLPTQRIHDRRGRGHDGGGVRMTPDQNRAPNKVEVQTSRVLVFPSRASVGVLCIPPCLLLQI